MAEQTCTCGTTWAVVPSTLKAHPGKRSEVVTVMVPDEDVFGRNPYKRTRATESSHWIAAGPSATLERHDTAQEAVYTWACLCGATLEHRTPRWYVVACQHGAGETGLCSVAAIRKNPPADLYVNARYGGACPCCGHQGTHLVTLGSAAPCGATA